MSWRLGIRHCTGYRYKGEVRSSYNEARVTPLSTDRQVALEASVTVTPNVAPFRYWDYWSSLVDAFDIHTPHTEMQVVGESVVETSPPLERTTDVSWANLSVDAVCDRYAELLAPTERVPHFEEAVEMGRTLAGQGAPAHAVEAASEWVRGRLRYEKGSTDVSTTAADVARIGSGVCQDFAHLMLAVLRTMGVPGRYVSGYLHPKSAAPVGETVIGQSHAWVEAWTGEWWPLDPTHGGPVGQRHVIVARGRDYGDVPPLKGIYHGGPSETLTVSVELTREA